MLILQLITIPNTHMDINIQLNSTLIKYTKLSDLLKIAINIQLKTLEIVRYETFSFQIVNFQLKYLELLNIRAT